MFKEHTIAALGRDPKYSSWSGKMLETHLMYATYYHAEQKKLQGIKGER